MKINSYLSYVSWIVTMENTESYNERRKMNEVVKGKIVEDDWLQKRGKYGRDDVGHEKKSAMNLKFCYTIYLVIFILNYLRFSQNSSKF